MFSYLCRVNDGGASGNRETLIEGRRFRHWGCNTDAPQCSYLNVAVAIGERILFEVHAKEYGRTLLGAQQHEIDEFARRYGVVLTDAKKKTVRDNT